MTTANVSRADVLQAIRDVAQREWKIDPATMSEKTNVADLGVDSVKQVRATALLEQKYGISVMEEGMKPAATVGGFADQIMAAMAKR